jgi:hypothetical protein
VSDDDPLAAGFTAKKDLKILGIKIPLPPLEHIARPWESGV